MSEVESAPIQEAPPQQANDNRPTTQQHNFKELRDANHSIGLERDALQAKLDNLEKTKTSAGESGLAETRKELKEMKADWARQKATGESKEIATQLRSEYSDLDEVVSQENLALLKTRDPRFAAVIDRQDGSPDDLYHRAIAAYSLIKKYGIHTDDPHEKDKARVEDNMSKPRPVSAASTGSQSLSEFSEFANMNSSDRRKAIFKLARERANG